MNEKKEVYSRTDHPNPYRRRRREVAQLHLYAGGYGIAESFMYKLRGECLNLNLFRNIEEAKEIIQNYVSFYNRERPYSNLHYKTPVEFERSIAVI